MKISVIIPSRCDIDARSAYKDLFLDRALQTIRNQTEHIYEICIGVQAHTKSLDRLIAFYPDWNIRIVVTDRKGQAAALNEAAAVASGDLLAFLEDDDLWHPKRLMYGLKLLKEMDCEFVSSNQEEVTAEGNHLRINDFPTPSGWLLTHELWLKSGGFDETHRWHLDCDFLGKLSKLQTKRAHLVERGSKLDGRDWLSNVSRFSSICCTSEKDPLVTRLINPRGGMSTITSDATALEQSTIERKRIHEKYGFMPW